MVPMALNKYAKGISFSLMGKKKKKKKKKKKSTLYN